MSDRILNREITVCASCLQASCWLGNFMCENARGAGTKILSVDELRRLNREHPEYWFKSPHTGAIDQHALAEYNAVTFHGETK